MITQIYCDSADYKIIKKYSNYKIVKGFTTNPSLMRKAGAKNYEIYSRKILKITSKPVSLEVFADNGKEIREQAYKLSSLGRNVFVKIPVYTTSKKFTGDIINELNLKGIKLNITAVYTFGQVKKIYNCIQSDAKVIISIFAGRMADTGINPIPIFNNSIKLTKKKPNIKILWASTREAYNYLQAKKIGCGIITMPPKIIDQIKDFGKSSNQLTIETVKGFLNDSKSSRFFLK